MKKLTYRKSGTKPVWDEETTKTIVGLLKQKYQVFLNDEVFEVESGWDAEQVQIKTTLRRMDGSVAYPIECVYPVSDLREEPEDFANLMLDYIDVYWSEYLSEGRETFLPIDWSKHTCEGVDFFVRGFVRNLALEQAADSLFEEEGCGDHEILPISSES